MTGDRVFITTESKRIKRVFIHRGMGCLNGFSAMDGAPDIILGSHFAMTDEKDAIHSEGNSGKLGTFAGVFTPSILTILGIILFLRLGYVVGEGGFKRTILILLIANAISILTTVSLSAIATNFKVKGGGDYYLISRTLGVEFGGAIGIVLFMAQAVSIAFYCIGFGEAVNAILPPGTPVSPRIIALGAVAFLFVFAWMGADWASKFQFVVMALLGLALASFFIGGVPKWESATFLANWDRPESGVGFWVLFAIFFPAVTGFTQGVSMSGDLRDPGKSLPRGTFVAVFLSMAVYFAVAAIFAGSWPLSTLAQDYSAMNRTALVGWLIDAGVIAATLSSAMASFLGAPRILQSLSGDKIFKFLTPFAKGYGVSNNPRRGVLLSAVIAIITIGAGNLNLIAPVVSMFFLISYGLLNYATYYEAKSASPSFRPRFRWFNKYLSLAGCLACAGVMLAIDFSTGAISAAILLAIYHYLKRTAGPARWADSQRSYYLQQARKNLFLAEEEMEHPRDWTPRILAISNDSDRRKPLLEFASWIQGKSGVASAIKILEGSGGRMLKLKEEAEAELEKDIDALEIEAFHRVIVAPESGVGLDILIQSFGIGPIQANTLLLNGTDKISRGRAELSQFKYVSHIRAAFRLGCNILILDEKGDGWNELSALPGEQRQIAVLWNNDHVSELMLMLAYLISKGDGWEDSKIRALDMTFGPDGKKRAEILKQRLDDFRITAEAVAIPEKDALAAELREASIVFVPFRFQGGMIQTPFDETIESALSPAKALVMAMAAQDIDLDAGPEDGPAAELAVATDEADKKKKVAEKAEKEANEASRQITELMERLEKEIDSNDDKAAMAELVSEIRKARQDAAEAMKRAAKKQAIAKSAAADIEDFQGGSL